jgi:tRNA(adenine34) deaminase
VRDEVTEPSTGVSDDDAMALALDQAKLAAERGEVPVGAVVVVDGVVVAAAHNLRETTADPTAHAEVLALRAAGDALGTWRLGDATLYVTLEPCAMCAGAAVSARLGRLVFGAADPKAGAVGSLYNLAADPRLNHEIPWSSGVRAAECAELLEAFFSSRR